MSLSFTPEQLGSLELVEQAMNQVVQRYFYDGQFFQTLRNGDYSMLQLRYFAIQYSYYSRHFPRVLGAAISAMEPRSTWWVPLADNLWDEAGRGIRGHSHEALYRTFLHSVDPTIELDPYGIPLVPMSCAVSEAISEFITFFHHAKPLEAMAAVGLGSEFFAGAVMGTISEGLRHATYHRAHSLDLTFWDVHAEEHEPRHYQLCKEILAQCEDAGSLHIMYETGKKIAISEAMMYANLHDEMIAL